MSATRRLQTPYSMQPSPIAETVRPLFPSLRLCTLSPPPNQDIAHQ